MPMSVDHKPGRKAESRRILRSGGYLDETDPHNPRVVCDTLKVRGRKRKVQAPQVTRREK